MSTTPLLHRWLVAAIAAAGAQACIEEGVAPCEDPVPITIDDGQQTGYVRCADGLTDRTGPAACVPQPGFTSCAGPSEFGGTCTVDADCNAGAHGVCAEIYGGGSYYECACRYGCASDDDCGPGSACACMGEFSACVAAACTSDADCASGRCGVGWAPEDCTTMPRMVCRTEADACQADDDCDGYDSCIVRDGVRVCEALAICGRPLMLDGVARVAAIGDVGGWRRACEPTLRGANPELRAALAAQWAGIGALEHASVASFARFTLELMACGAPADLIAEAQQAGADEVEHARLAFGLASAYAGQPVGPGPLDIHGVDVRSDVDTIVASLIDEGCIGEILGAVEARAAAELADDPTVAAIYSRIAEDEARHALLAWRSLHWLLERGADRDLAVERLRATVARIEARRPTPGPHRPASGLWSDRARQAAHGLALRAVVGPLVDGLAAQG